MTFAGALSAIAATSVTAHADVNGSRSGQFDVTEQTTNTTETTRPKQTVVFFVEVSSVTDVPGQRLDDMRARVKPLWDNMIPGDRLILYMMITYLKHSMVMLVCSLRDKMNLVQVII